MNRITFAAPLLAISLLANSPLAFAIPDVNAVQAEVAKGRYTEAESMMREVLGARPDSARAHYVYAEILAHDRHFDQAAEQVAAARRIDPELKFTTPAKSGEFTKLLERELGGERHTGLSAQSSALSSVPARIGLNGTQAPWGLSPWMLIAAALAALTLLFSLFRRRASPPTLARFEGTRNASEPVGGDSNAGATRTPQPQPVSQQAWAGQTLQTQVPPPPSGGLLGKGAALAGGLAAGMLAERLLDGRHDQGSGWGNSSSGRSGAPSGEVPGRNDADIAAGELEQRPIDMGAGGDDPQAFFLGKADNASEFFWPYLLRSFDIEMNRQTSLGKVLREQQVKHPRLLCGLRMAKDFCGDFAKRSRIVSTKQLGQRLLDRVKRPGDLGRIDRFQVGSGVGTKSKLRQQYADAHRGRRVHKHSSLGIKEVAQRKNTGRRHTAWRCLRLQ